MNKIAIAFITTILALLVYWFYFKKENPQDYENQITIYRHERAEFFRYSPESPFLTQKVNFSYLDYYPTNINLKIEAQFDKNRTLDTLSLATSTGTIDKFIVLGTASFQFQNQMNSLLVLGSVNPNDPSLFIPYLDKTSGEVTYGGGRYLDVNAPSDNSMLLDFNKSYNPYCAYTDGYTCPFPPKENRLKIAIEAGEKSYKSH